MSTVEEHAVGAADSKGSEHCSPKTEKLPEIENLKIDDISIPEQNKSEPKYDSDAESFDEEEYKLWIHQMGASGGFDVTVSPHGVMGSFKVFNDLNELTDAERQECDDFVKIAIEHYNKRESANLELVKLLKVNISGCGGIMYYLTFEAKEALCGSVGSYQAQVFDTFKLRGPEEIEVLICRKKPENKPDTSDLDLEEKSWPCGCSWPCACEAFDLWA